MEDHLFKEIETGDDLFVTVYRAEGQSLDELRPAIVFFFGGGWVSGSRAHFQKQAEWLARKGFVCVAADYRTSKSHGTKPSVALVDAKSAMRWVRTSADKLGIDPDRIASAGGSAGGHLAAATVMSQGFDDPADDLSVSPAPQAMLLFNPVIDNGPGQYGHSRVKDYYKEFSPRFNIKPGLPPAIVFLGTNDKHYSVEAAHEFEKEMKEAGNRYDLVLYEDQEHGFFNHRGPNNHEYFDKTIEASYEFLQSIGWADENGAVPAKK